MKLPEYDNRPGPNTPLYTDPNEADHDWNVSKVFLGFIAIFASLAAIAYGVVTAIGSIF